MDDSSVRAVCCDAVGLGLRLRRDVVGVRLVTVHSRPWFLTDCGYQSNPIVVCTTTCAQCCGKTSVSREAHFAPVFVIFIFKFRILNIVEGNYLVLEIPAFPHKRVSVGQRKSSYVNYRHMTEGRTQTLARGNESVPKIIINVTIALFLKRQSAFW